MKKSLLFYSIVAITIALFSSCKKDKIDDTLPDPEGTITTTLPFYSNAIIYQGVAEDPYFGGRFNFPYVQIGMRVDYSSLLTVIIALYSTDEGKTYGDYVTDGAEVANIGQVNGIGSVTLKPRNGYTSQCAIEKGHGYVIRYKKSFHINSVALPYFYARFYVMDFITNANVGEVNGAKIKYQGSF